MKRRGILAAAAALALAVTTLPADMIKKAPAPDLPPELMEWTFVLGSWEMDSKRYSLEDGSVIEENPGKARFTMALEGQRIRERQTTSMGGKPMEVLNLFAFRPDRKSWEIAWTDTLHQSFSLYKGESVDGAIVLREKSPDPGSRVTRRVTYKRLDGGRFSRLLEFSEDQGKTWVRRNETVYTRSR